MNRRHLTVDPVRSSLVLEFFLAFVLNRAVPCSIMSFNVRSFAVMFIGERSGGGVYLCEWV